MTVSLCTMCGLMLSGDLALCPHHHCDFGDDWAVANRIMCDIVHREWIPPRLPGAGLQIKVVLALGAAGLPHIDVHAENDTVSLCGNVRSQDEGKHAVKIAASVQGVREVINDLML